MGHTIDKNKLGVFLLVALVLGAGIYVFSLKQDFIEAFELYQVKAYTTGFEYGVLRTSDLLASIVSLGRERALAETNANTEAVPVLLYHGIPNKARGDYDVALDEFKQQMIALKLDGWQTITLDELYRFKKGEIALPEKSFLITFDDGRKDSYYAADPVLRSLGYNAVMFVATIEPNVLEESNYYLEADELERMAKTGRWEIQSHGHSASRPTVIDSNGTTEHFLSNRVWLREENRLETETEAEARIKNDLNQSEDYLEKLTGKDVIAFAFPFGDFGYAGANFEEAESIVLAAANEIYPLSFYQADVSLRGRRFTAEYPEPGGNSFFIARIELHPGLRGEELVRLMNGVSARTLPYEDSFDEDNDNWIITWGDVAYAGGNLEMKATAETTGSMTILDGSKTWQNYSFKAKIRDFRGSNLYLIFRFQDDNNFAACNFGRDRVHVEETINGRREVIRGANQILLYPASGFDVEVRVSNRGIECLYNGQVVAGSQFLDLALSNGGIGLKGWDQTLGESRILIESIIVEPYERVGTVQW
ncbi:MAG: polysaccharide deacetylase family protein [Candidatus Colwellbacteria bacterium]|nr:polysaccharide deacetylase family protein [Candidatus Colwellbacteria bacterium]